MYRIGHSSPQAALRYQHATTSRDIAIANGISKLIRSERTGGDGVLDPASTGRRDRARDRSGDGFQDKLHL